MAMNLSMNKRSSNSFSSGRRASSLVVYKTIPRKVSTCDRTIDFFAGDWYAKVYVSEEVENDVQLPFCMFHRGPEGELQA